MSPRTIASESHLARLWSGSIAALGAVLLSTTVRADEGQWMPKQIAELDPAPMRAAGLELEADALWNDRDGGVMRAVVNLSGCSAGFVSPEGLIATNHHCAYGAIQSASDLAHDYLSNGFLARTRGDELVAKDSFVQIVVSVEDVTEQIHAIVAAERDPVARAHAVETRRRELVRDCEAVAGQRCRVAEFYKGAEYQLITSIELTDVRIVYAPPSMVGNFGGETDNWMWPRHTGDFTLLRAYVGPDGKPAEHAEANVPYRPQRHLEVGTTGVSPGSFVAVLGFPGTTQRYQTAAEVSRHLEQVFPARVDLYGEWIAIMEKLGAADPAIKLAVAAKLKGLANRHKNGQGMIDGLTRNDTVQRRAREDDELARWAEQNGDAAARETLARLVAISASRRETYARDVLVENLSRGANSLAIAIDVVRHARELAKPDLERANGFLERNAKELWSTQTTRIRDFKPAVDRELGTSLVRRVGALPTSLRFTTMTAAKVAAATSRTRMGEEAYVRKLWDADVATIERERDPMIAWARELVTAIEALEAADRERDGEMLELGPRYFAMLKQHRKGPVYPDANGTLRFSWATVGGYSPRDGLLATAQTTVRGMIAKHTGQDPFDVPQRVRDAAPAARTSVWADPALDDVVVAMLTNADTTGGNSGSPVIDGRGRWVGLNFDRVWENVAGDFGYSEERSRNVVVDVRYLLWILDEIEHADALLAELGVAELAAAPARVVAPPSTTAGTAAAPSVRTASVGNTVEFGALPADAVATPLVVSSGCGCRSASSHAPVTLLVSLALVGRARRRRSGRKIAIT